MIALVLLLAALCALPAVNTFVNAFLLRTPPLPAERPSVAILIPARNEAERIGACLDAAMASDGVDFEVIVLDDQSADATAEIVRRRAGSDARLRLAAAPPLPPGWKGKPHACQVLASLTNKPLLLFIDADVLLAPDAAARLAPPPGISLVSGVPRQLVRGLIETAVVPMINFLIFGYLPVAYMRRFSTMPALTVACGQLMMARAADYARAGGHAAVREALHDGLKLARHFRKCGLATDFVQAADLADCKMYDGARETWDGFSKNATEGMATPRALPVWTALLAGGVLCPPLALLYFGISAEGAILALAILVLACARALQARVCREPALAVLLLPVGVALTLAIQYGALIAKWRGRTVAWRGRSYRPLSG
jgi:hypothetical protein